MHSLPGSVARLGSAVGLLILALIPQSVNGAPGEDSAYSLGLASAESPGLGFALDLASLPVFDPSVEWDSVSKGPPLVLESSIRNPQFDASTLLDFKDELAERRWSNGKGRLEAHLRADMLDQMSGGMVGYFQDGAGLDVLALFRVIKAIHKSIKRNRLPLGARVPHDGSMTLIVREDDGSIPESITVLPSTLGWVGDVTVASCDSSGKCRADGLPDESSVLLIRGDGGGLIALPSGGGQHHLVLKENGTLKLRPPVGAEEVLHARIIHTQTGMIVPVIRWLNPERGEWFKIPNVGLPLLLPEATYEVEWMGDVSPKQSMSIEIEADITVEVVLGP